MPQGKHPEEELASFIARYTPEIASLARVILAKMRERYPAAIELVYDNYNALAVGFASTERPSDAIFSIALYPAWISLFFLQARGLEDPHKILRGSGSVAKHIRLPSPDALNDPTVHALMQEAVAKAAVSFDPRGAHRLIIRSVSTKQRPRRPAKKTGAQKSDPKVKSKGNREKVKDLPKSNGKP